MINNEQNRQILFFSEATLNLQHEGFTAGQTKDGLLPVAMDGQHLCQVTDSGGVRYWKEDVTGDARNAALDRVTEITRLTAEYMGQMEATPQLAAGSLKGDYRLLADFNDTVLAGHPTKYGVQFITWERTHDRTALDQGHYHGPYVGVESYTAAKRDFATRSGLIPRNDLFTPEQLTEIYRCIHETLNSGYPITDERQKCLESAAKQIESTVPDLDERAAISNTKELEYADMKSAQDSGIQFC